MTETNRIGPGTPFLIVSDVSRSVKHYTEALGFECRFSAPDTDPIFAIVGRDAVQIMLKFVGDEVPPSPNNQQHEWARWDVFVHVPDPDVLAGEFERRRVPFHQVLGDTEDQLRGFEIADPDGYVCFFGRPL